MEGRGAPVLRGGDFEFSLDYNQIKEGCGGAGVGVWGVGGGGRCCVAPGLSGALERGCSLF